jgi:hypothetical protein
MVVDLNGPDGNAFALIGIARQCAKKLGMDKEEVTDNLTGLPYEELIRQFDRYFGDYVDLVLPRGVTPLPSIEVQIDF